MRKLIFVYFIYLGNVLWVVFSVMEEERWIREKCFKIIIIGFGGWLELVEERI